MVMNKSMVLHALYPETRTNFGAFIFAVDLLWSKGYSVVEYPVGDTAARRRGAYVKACGMRSVYLGAGDQKQLHSSLCHIDETERQKAVDLAKRLIERANEAQAISILLTSGRYPGGGDAEARAWDALEESLVSLLPLLHREMGITLEPGDRTVESLQLMGPLPDTLAFMERMAQYGDKISLTVDSSHCKQLGENETEVMTAAKPYCGHVHIANCVLQKGDPLYGDKHVRFGHDNSCYSLQDAKNMVRFVSELYTDSDVIVGMEIINRMEPAQQEEEALRILDHIAWF